MSKVQAAIRGTQLKMTRLSASVAVSNKGTERANDCVKKMTLKSHEQREINFSKLTFDSNWLAKN